jgi:hypothetical protein
VLLLKCKLKPLSPAVGLRMQVDASGEIGMAPERAFGGYVLAICVLFLASWTYIG